VPEPLRPMFDNLGDISSQVDGLKGMVASGRAAAIVNNVNETVHCLTQIQSIYTGADQGLNSVRDMRTQLGGLDVDVARRILLQLEADEEHLKNQVAIIARRNDEHVDLLHILADYQVRFQRSGLRDSDTVAETLFRAGSGNDPEEARAAVNEQARMLYDAAALASHGETPAALARLRLAQEEERYSIRKSAAEAQAYEDILSTGLRRLALYYAGGLKPEAVAQLLFNALSLANLGYLTYAR